MDIPWSDYSCPLLNWSNWNLEHWFLTHSSLSYILHPTNKWSQQTDLLTNECHLHIDVRPNAPHKQFYSQDLSDSPFRVYVIHFLIITKFLRILCWIKYYSLNCIFLYSHHLSVKYYIATRKRNHILIPFDFERINLLVNYINL